MDHTHEVKDMSKAWIHLPKLGKWGPMSTGLPVIITPWSALF